MEEGERARSQKSEVSPPQRSADKESEVGRQTDGRGPPPRREDRCARKRDEWAGIVSKHLHEELWQKHRASFF